MGNLTWRNETRRLGDLVPQPDNPRHIGEAQARRLKESREKFDQPQTIAIGPDDDVYDGHQRLKVWLPEWGPDLEVAVRVSSRPLTEGERKELVVLLHEGATGDWDWPKLEGWAEPEKLLEWGFDKEALELAGFDVAADSPPAPPAQIDRAAELQEKWQVERGQVWEAGRHRVMCGDSVSDSPILMQDERAQLGITSPPYAVGKEYEAGVSFAEHLALLRNIADVALDAIEPGGFWFINFGEIAAQSHTKPLTGSDRQCLYPISKDYWQICHVERGMDLYAMRIWYKPFNRLQQPF